LGRLAKNIGLVFVFIGVGVVGAYFTNYAGFKDWVDYNFFTRPQRYQELSPEEDGTFLGNITNGFDTNSMRLVNQ